MANYLMKTTVSVVLILAVTLVAALLSNQKPKISPSSAPKAAQAPIPSATAKKPDTIVLTASVSEITLPGN
jgi:hypothetical protein